MIYLLIYFSFTWSIWLCRSSWLRCELSVSRGSYSNPFSKVDWWKQSVIGRRLQQKQGTVRKHKPLNVVWQITLFPGRKWRVKWTNPQLEKQQSLGEEPIERHPMQGYIPFQKSCNLCLLVVDVRNIPTWREFLWVYLSQTEDSCREAGSQMRHRGPRVVS